MPRKSLASQGFRAADRYNTRLYPRHKEMLDIMSKKSNTNKSAFLRSLIEKEAMAIGVFISEKAVK